MDQDVEPVFSHRLYAPQWRLLVGTHTTSELTEVGDFSEVLCQVFLYSISHKVRGSTLGENLAGCPFLGRRKQRPGNWTFYSQISPFVVQIPSGIRPIEIIEIFSTL